MIISKGRSLLARWLLVGLLVGCSTSLRAFAEKRADFRCSYTYQKTTVTTTKNNPARSDGGRDSKVEKSKVALRRIFVFPLLLDTLALSQCLRSARNVTAHRYGAPRQRRTGQNGSALARVGIRAAGALKICGTDAQRATRYARDTTALTHRWRALRRATTHGARADTSGACNA